MYALYGGCDKTNQSKSNIFIFEWLCVNLKKHHVSPIEKGRVFFTRGEPTIHTE